MPAWKSVHLSRPIRWQLPSPPNDVASLPSPTTAAAPTGPTLADVLRGINDVKSEIASIKSEISNLKKNQTKILDALNTINQHQWLAVELDFTGV